MDRDNSLPSWRSPRPDELMAEMQDELDHDPNALLRSPYRFHPYFRAPEADDYDDYYAPSPDGHLSDLSDNDYYAPSPDGHLSEPNDDPYGDMEARDHPYFPAPDDEDDDYYSPSPNGHLSDIYPSDSEAMIIDPPPDEPMADQAPADDEDGDFSQFFDLVPLSTHKSRKIHTEVMEYKATVKNSDHLSGEQMLWRLKYILQGMLKQTMLGLKDDDFYRLIIQSGGLRRPISIAYTRVNEFDLANIFRHIEKVMQSNETVRLDNSFFLNVARTYWPEPGRGRQSGGLQARRIALFERWLATKQTIIDVPARDGICGFLAVVLARELAEGKCYVDLRMKKRWQRAECEALAALAGLDLNTGLTVDGMAKVQQVLPDYQLAVYEPCEGAADSLNLLFRGDPRDKHLNLLYYNAHYYIVKSMKALYDRKNFCYACCKAFDKKHFCAALCKFCQSPSCENRGTQRTIFDAEPCENCGIELRTEHCIQGHLERCALFAVCPTCLLIWPRKKLEPPEKHHCMERYCRSCWQWRPRFVQHQCYIPSGAGYVAPILNTTDSSLSADDQEDDGASLATNDTVPKPEMAHELYFLDFETTVTSCSAGRHYASILCVCQHASGDKNLERIFEGASAADDFLTYITEMDYRHTRRTFIAHYAQGFDTFCYLKCIYERKLKIELISRGQKITYLGLMNGRLRMIDSLAYIPMGLAAFSSAFGIEETKKGFFPYAVLRCRDGEDPEHIVERLKQPIPFPSREMFDEGGMMPKRRSEFDKFYIEACAHFATREYIPWKELVEYCVADVELLRKSCNIFLELYQEHMNFDCFANAITLTSANFQTFCKNFVPKDRIAIIGDMGLMRGQFSRIALVWLEYLMRDNMIQIRHATNGGEIQLGPYKPDGHSTLPPRFTYHNRRWKDAECVYLFHGCLWHGCPTCVKDRSQIFMGLSAAERYANTVRVEKYFRDRGFNVITEWSCQFEPMMRRRPDLLVEARLAGALQPRLLPREAYFGGRVEAFKLLHRCEPGTKVHYYDINGLYPYVMLSAEMYCGVPEIIRSNFKDPSEYRGLVYGRFVNKNRSLFLPVLPTREGGKLFFSNCLACTKSKNTDDCNHTDSERAITSIVTTEELALARSKGYEVLEMYEVWHYPPEQRDRQIFQRFEGTWMVLKAEAQGWPESIANDDAAKQRYIDEYRERFGIVIDPSKVRKNNALKTVAKLSGNALYGRLGLREQRTCVTVANQFEDIRSLLVDPCVEVRDVHLVNDDVSFITWSYKEGAAPASDSVNLVMTVQITSYARLHLYNILDAVHSTPGCQLLYTDTDSVLFVGPEEGFTPPFAVGDILGELKDETSEFGPQARIKDWYCTGSKSYGYSVHFPDAPPKTVMKLKGFRLDYGTQQVITPEAIIKMIEQQDETESILVHYPNRVVREMKTGTMKERDTKKRYRLTADKRIVRPDEGFLTVPYGYQYV